VELVDRSLPDGDRVTQFELLTAAAYGELAAADVEVGVIEAGLGGRYDATNVIPSKVQVLTSVGLEHTRWLGPTIADIAGEKLDVVKPGGTLVLGYGLAAEAEAVAERVAEQRGARIVRAPADPGVAVGAPGEFQRRNFALAKTAAECYLGGRLNGEAVAAAAAGVRVPGRLEVIDERPLTVLDGAHNAEGMAALALSLPELVDHRPVEIVAVLSVLSDKDAAGMLRALLPVCRTLVLTASSNPRTLPPATLQSLTRQLGGPPTEIVPDAHAALARARALAGPEGAVLATGSLYLVGELLSPIGHRRASIL
jgi:dihydrofolate synthase/folylpolyglutamate synthase